MSSTTAGSTTAAAAKKEDDVPVIITDGSHNVVVKARSNKKDDVPVVFTDGSHRIVGNKISIKKQRQQKEIDINATPYRMFMDADQQNFNEYDAIFGQGGRANQIRSGSRFRQLIVKHSDAYSSIPARDSTSKHKFVYQQVVNPLQSKGGRFFCLEGGKIKELNLQLKADARTMMTKIQQALRDERKRARAQFRQQGRGSVTSAGGGANGVAAGNAAAAAGAQGKNGAATDNGDDAAIPTKAGPYDTVFGQHAAAKKARQGSVFEKLISTLSDTYFAMDKQYNHHAPYTKYDFCREQVVKPLMSQGGRFYYIKGGELAELKYHENADCKIIMARIQQSFDLELKRRQGGGSPQSREAIRSSFHQRNLPSHQQQQQHHAHYPGHHHHHHHQYNNPNVMPPLYGSNRSQQPMDVVSNFPSSSLHAKAPVVDANGHPVIGASDNAMEALRVALQPTTSKGGDGQPLQGGGSNGRNGSGNGNDENNQNMADAHVPMRHDLGDDYGKLYFKKDTYFGQPLELYHQKSDFCALVTKHCPAYTTIGGNDFRSRQEFVFQHIMEPLLENEGRFFILQEGVMKELDLYDEIDCRILLTSIQQAFFDENKRRKRVKAAAAAKAAAAGEGDKDKGGGDKDKGANKDTADNKEKSGGGDDKEKGKENETDEKEKENQKDGKAKKEEGGHHDNEEDESEDEDDGMFSDAEDESTMQPVMGIDEESMRSLFSNLRDKIQLTV